MDVHGAAFGGFAPDGRVGDEVRREVSFGVDARDEVGRRKEFGAVFEMTVDYLFEIFESDTGVFSGGAKNVQLSHGFSLLLMYYESIIAQTG